MRRTLGETKPHTQPPCKVGINDQASRLSHPFRVAMMMRPQFPRVRRGRRPWAMLFNSFGVKQLQPRRFWNYRISLFRVFVIGLRHYPSFAGTFVNRHQVRRHNMFADLYIRQNAGVPGPIFTGKNGTVQNRATTVAASFPTCRLWAICGRWFISGRIPSCKLPDFSLP